MCRTVVIRSSAALVTGRLHLGVRSSAAVEFCLHVSLLSSLPSCLVTVIAWLELYARVLLVGEVPVQIWSAFSGSSFISFLLPGDVQAVLEEWNGDAIRLPHVCGEWGFFSFPLCCRCVERFENLCVILRQRRKMTHKYTTGIPQWLFQCCFIQLWVVATLSFGFCRGK